MESMALAQRKLLGLAYVGVFLIKSEYIKKTQSSNLFTARSKTYVGEVTADMLQFPPKINILPAKEMKVLHQIQPPVKEYMIIWKQRTEGDGKTT